MFFNSFFKLVTYYIKNNFFLYHYAIIYNITRLYNIHEYFFFHSFYKKRAVFARDKAADCKQREGKQGAKIRETNVKVSLNRLAVFLIG